MAKKSGGNLGSPTQPAKTRTSQVAKAVGMNPRPEGVPSGAGVVPPLRNTVGTVSAEKMTTIGK